VLACLHRGKGTRELGTIINSPTDPPVKRNAVRIGQLLPLSPFPRAGAKRAGNRAGAVPCHALRGAPPVSPSAAFVLVRNWYAVRGKPLCG
jgi:hypothetical protein